MTIMEFFIADQLTHENQQAIKTNTTDKVKFEVGYLQNYDGNEEGRLIFVIRICKRVKTADDSWPRLWNARKGVF
jgi:hypothetical protein